MSKTFAVKTFENVAFNVMGRSVSFIFSGLSNLILSRNLVSSDYGIVGFATIFTNFISLFNDLGIGPAIIQKPELSDRELYAAFSIKAVLGIAFTILCFLISPLVPVFFGNDEKIINVLRILSLNFIINIFFFLPGSILTRDLNYKRLALTTLCSSIICSLVAIAMALNGFKYWTIVFSNLTATLVAAIVANLFKPVKIKFYFDWKIISVFLHSGGPVFISSLVVFTIFNTDNFIVGMMGGSEALGFYVIGFTWGTFICSLMSSLILAVFFPAFSRIQTEKEKIKTSYLKLLEFISFAGILSNLVLFIISQEFLVYILGSGTEKWLPALTTLRIFCFYGIIRVLLEPIGSVIMASGKNKVLIKAALTTAILELGLIYPALKAYGIEGVAAAVTLAYSVQYLIYLPYLKREFEIHPLEILKAITPAAVSLLAILVIYFIFRSLPMEGIPVLFLLPQKIISSLVCYILLYGIFTKWKMFKEAKVILNAR